MRYRRCDTGGLLVGTLVVSQVRALDPKSAGVALVGRLRVLSLLVSEVGVGDDTSGLRVDEVSFQPALMLVSPSTNTNTCVHRLWSC